VADQAAEAVRDRGATGLTLVVVSATVTPLGLGGPLIEVDTGRPGAGAAAVAAVRAAIG
jgi:hypothetical protein